MKLLTEKLSHNYEALPTMLDHHPKHVKVPGVNPRPVVDLPTSERWKAELTLMLVIYLDGLVVSR